MYIFIFYICIILISMYNLHSIYCFAVNRCEVEHLTLNPDAPAVDLKRVADDKLTEIQHAQEDSESDREEFEES